MPTPITVNVNFIDLMGTAFSGYMEAAIVSPSGVYDLYVAGTGMIAPKTITSTVGTSVSVQIWGNDVVVDAADGANDTYYTINLFNTVNVLVWSAAYLFTGAGPINLVGYPILNPIPAPVAPTFPVVQPPGGATSDVQYNNGGVFAGDNGFRYISSLPSPLLSPVATLTVAGNGLSQTPIFEILGSGLTAADGAAFFLTPESGTGNTGTTRNTFLAFEMTPVGSGGITFIQNGRDGGGFTWQGSTSPNPGTLEVGVFGIINPSSITEMLFLSDAGIGFMLNNSTTFVPNILFDGNGIANFQALNLGLTNVVGTAIVLSNISGSVPSYIVKGSDDSLTIRTDAAAISLSPSLQLFQNGGLTINVPNCGNLLFQNGTTTSPWGNNAIVWTMFRSGSGPHGFAVAASAHTCSLFSNIDTGSFTQTSNAALSLVLSQVTVVGGTVTYTGTITGGSSNSFVGQVFAVSGFVNGGNNIASFTVTGSTLTTLVGTTSTQVNETHAGVAVTNYSGPAHILSGSWWNGSSAVTSITTLQDVIGTGTTPTDQFVISNSGANSWLGVSVSGAFAATTLTATAATPTGAAGTVGFGTTAGFGNGSAGTAMTTTTKNTGSGPTTPQTVVKYIEIDIAGTKFWLPLVQ